MDYESTALTNCAIEASFFGASGRNRTGTPLLISDFKSEASTDFATLANHVIIIYHTMIVVK